MTPRAFIPDHPARVLIVDDELHNRKLLEIVLQDEGYALSTAAGGAEAIAMVAAEPPDLILLDIMMPETNGFEVASRIKADRATRNIPIIMVTARDDREARMLGLNAGAEDFLTKPVDRAEVRVRVRNLLRLKAYGDYHEKHTHVLEGEVGSQAAHLMDGERLYRSTFDAAPVGIVHVGLDGQWLRVNQRLCDLLGFSAEELQGRPPECLPDEIEAFRAMVLGTRHRHVVDERRYLRHDGSIVWTRVNTSLHRDGEGQPRHFISVIEDITEHRALEAQIRQSNKMDAIGRLASGVAHDLNNLLTVISGFAEILAADFAPKTQHSNDLAEITAAAERATGLTRQLLAFSRQQVLHVSAVDVNALVLEMTGMLARLIGEDIEVALALAPSLSPALADRGQMEQVVMNLVVNARDAMPSGGRLSIETSDVDLDTSPWQEEEVVAGEYVMLALTDTGTGISPEARGHLFEPFFTTKELGKGTGLGLSTTYGIVKQCKGYIRVYSEPGLGTTFKVYLPRSPHDVLVPDVEPPGAAPVRASETVLLVEDEPGVRSLSRRILHGAGYAVLEAANGNEAEIVFAEHRDTIDLVLTDVVMPGCGGPELLSRLKVHAPGLRVLYMSGYTEQSAAHKAGMDRGLPFVLKPFTGAELVRQVRAALDR